DRGPVHEPGEGPGGAAQRQARRQAENQQHTGRRRVMDEHDDKIEECLRKASPMLKRLTFHYGPAVLVHVARVHMQEMESLSELFERAWALLAKIDECDDGVVAAYEANDQRMKVAERGAGLRTLVGAGVIEPPANARQSKAMVRWAGRRDPFKLLDELIARRPAFVTLAVKLYGGEA